MPRTSPSSLPNGPDLSEHLKMIADALATLRFGVIQLTIHDGRPVQIDITERRRFSQ
jgi:hypothetical protein